MPAACSSSLAPLSSLMVTTFDNVEDGEIISLEELVKKPSLKSKHNGLTATNKKLALANDPIDMKEAKKQSLTLEFKNPTQSSYLRNKKMGKANHEGTSFYSMLEILIKN